MNYSKVQFISWELYTGPSKNTTEHFYQGIGSNNTDDNRVDIVSQIKDIKARVVFTENAIKKAYEKADKNPSVLKIFMGPEFLYRGAGGAYLHDLLNGWIKDPFNIGKNDWLGLYGLLKSVIAKEEYKDWLFVFGTAISASFPVDKQNIIDIRKPAEVYNTSLIQLGGKNNENTCHVTKKHYKSGIDFLTHSRNIVHLANNTKHLEAENIIPFEGDIEGGAVFHIAGVNDFNGDPITFGIEICLDHAYSGGNYRNPYGRLRTANQKVSIQLVPSGGMELKVDSIMLKTPPKSYAFNCDGLNSLNSGHSCHTQIWDGTYNENKIFNINGGEPYLNTTVVPVDNLINGINAISLWDIGAGNVRIIDTPLPIQSKE